MAETGEDMSIQTAPFRYADFKAPEGYKCKCGKTGVKLWREYNTFLDQQTLYCVECACADQKKPMPETGDQIGWLVPAVPTEDGDTYWGYTSVPIMGCIWWDRLDGPAMTKEKVEKKIAYWQSNIELWNSLRDKQKPEYIAQQLSSCHIAVGQYYSMLFGPVLERLQHGETQNTTAAE